MTQATKGQKMFVGAWGRYQHEAIETKDVGGNTSSGVGVTHK